MSEYQDIKRGWDYISHLSGVAYADQRVELISNEIKRMESAINNHPHRGNTESTFQGYVFEELSAGTFNVDAVAAGAWDRAETLQSNGKGSVDIHLKSGDNYSAKSYATGEQCAVEQSLLDPETRKPIYEDQKRLVPEDKLSNARTESHKREIINRETKPEVSRAYNDTQKNLTDRISNKREGVESKPFRRSQIDRATKEAQQGDGEFKAEDVDVTVSNSIKNEYILRQALEAGYTSAALTVAFRIAPEIYKSIDYLIKNGEINIELLKQVGISAISGSAEGFINGAVACSVTLMAEKGLLGEAMKTVGGVWIGTTVSIIVESIKDSVQVAIGNLSVQEMGAAFVDRAILGAGFAIAGTKVVRVITGALVQALSAEMPIVGYLIGSLVGTAIASIYNIGKKKLLSICVDTGFTCFGLVDQDYEMPLEYLRQMGLDANIPDFVEADMIEPDLIEPDYIEPDYIEPDYASLETIEFFEIKRGIIGVNKIGYIPA